MKLLSMKTTRGNRAGILIGDEALDYSRYLEVILRKAAIFHDAIDLYNAGLDRLQETISAMQSDPQLAIECRDADALLPLSDISFNTPVLVPSKILAVGLNYASHIAEQSGKQPESPLIFSKCTTALIAAGEAIRLPRISDMIDYEAELAVIIGREAKSIRRDEATDYIAGYTIMNDVTARDLQRRERQWARAKGLDTFAPCGPWMVTSDEIPNPHALDIELRVNGELRQQANTADLIHDIPALVEFISQDLTLRPGDIISTGTPSGVGVYLDPPVFLKAGDRIEIRIERIGTLSNHVVGRES
ncbi:MAG: fumarylacetoacetate hydrolase family protein [Acidobacteriota bacterium]